MKKEVKLLKVKALDSLILSIEHFNRPYDRGRVCSVLIFLDHSFEMLMKASILHKGGKIREKRARQTLGFDACLRKALSDGNIKFITEEQALTLQSINSLRDAAQHHLLDISEQHLYIQAQAGLSLFKDIYKRTFDVDLKKDMPERVLPLSTQPPLTLEGLFDTETQDIKKLLKPKSRKKIEALAKLRSLAIVEGAVNGERYQPSQGDLRHFAEQVKAGLSWNAIFPGVASINMTSTGYGPSIDLKITKHTGTPIQLVPEGTPGATVVAIKRVDDLGFYHLGRDQLAKHVGLTGPKTSAIIDYLKLRDDSECFKKIIIGGTKFNRYSTKAVELIKTTIEKESVEDIWNRFGDRYRGKGK